MTDDLPPRRHPADPPWWHWRYVNVRGWARMRRLGRFGFGLIAGAAYAALQLASRPLAVRWGYDPPSIGGAVVAGIVVGTVTTLSIWNWTDRRYHQALRRRAEYDADRDDARLG
jgi:hypothetical protein